MHVQMHIGVDLRRFHVYVYMHSMILQEYDHPLTHLHISRGPLQNPRKFYQTNHVQITNFPNKIQKHKTTHVQSSQKWSKQGARVARAHAQGMCDSHSHCRMCTSTCIRICTIAPVWMQVAQGVSRSSKGKSRCESRGETGV